MPPPESAPMPRRLALRYSASGGRPVTDAWLELPESGPARMFLGSTASLPPAGELHAVGLFEGPVDDAARSLLADVLGPVPSGPGAGEVPLPGSVIRHLAVTVEGVARPEVTVPGAAAPPLDVVETILQQVMTALVAHPLEAVGLAFDGRDAWVLTSVGSSPIRLLLAGLRGTAVLSGRSGAVLGAAPVAAPGDDECTLAPGGARRIDLTVPDPGRGRLSGGLEFAAHVAGRSRPLSLQAPPVTLR